MDVRNCKICGKIFNHIGGEPLCPTCIKKMDDKFVEVKEYIYTHPGVGVQEVSEENDIPVSLIKKWIREERLCFSEDSASGIECETCGTMIKTGRFCSKCKDHMANTLGNAYQTKVPVVTIDKKVKDKDRMRFLDK
jgi:predicted amidophosphoribosyltransferase